MIRKIILVTALLFLNACAGADPQEVVTISSKDAASNVFHVELALTYEEHERGLMMRKSLPQDVGMLFIFPDIEQRVFWMKNTLIPLDMLFIDKDGTINHIHHMAKPQDLTRITSNRPAKAVLEINGGLCDVLGIKEGDKIIHPVFRNQLDD